MASNEPWRAGDYLALCGASGPVTITIIHAPTGTTLHEAGFTKVPAC